MAAGWLMSALAAMLLPLLMSSCSSVELAEADTLEEKAEWNFAIAADRDEGVETRALTETANQLKSAWDPQYDYIYVYNKTKNKLSDKALKPNQKGASATLEGTFESGKYEVGDQLLLMLHFSTYYICFNYSDCLGTLENIANNADCAIAEVEVTEVDGTNVKTTHASFKNQQSIFKVNFEHGGKPLNVKLVKVSKSDGKLYKRYCPYNDYYSEQGTVIVYGADEPSSEVWMALRSDSGEDDTYTFTVTDENNVEYVGVKKKGFDIGKFYTTTIQVRVPFDSQNTPLTVEAVEAGTITIANPLKLSIQYSLNDGEKNSSSANPITISASAGDKVQLYGDNQTYSDGPWTSSKRTNISFSSDYYVYGNIMSLVKSTGFETLTTLEGESNFIGLFRDNEHLLSHADKQLLLPATTVPDYAYSSMFNNCPNLTIAPELPATTVGKSSYSGMFSKCTNLTVAPSVLPAKTITGSMSYEGMFADCTSLKKAPEILAEEFVDETCQNMFIRCSGLETVPDLHATKLGYHSCWGMFQTCVSLKKAPALPATVMARGCYDSMFLGCRSLESVPDITVTEFATSCFNGMFKYCTSLKATPVLHGTGAVQYLSSCNEMFFGCTNLKKVTCYFTPRQVEYYDGPEWTTKKWMTGVASKGTFIKKKGVEWPSGVDGIPEGWTVKEVE